MKVLDSLAKQASSIAAIRRDIHAHPELCFEEIRTADLVAQKLTEWGIPIHRGMGKTGVVGILKCGTSERAIGLRAGNHGAVTRRRQSTRRSPSIMITCACARATAPSAPS